MRAYQQHRAHLDHQLADAKHRMRQADDFDVEAVGVMPPVVEGGRREHHESAPRRHEASERPAKAPDRDAGVLGLIRRTEGGRQNRVAAGDSGQHAREIDHHMRGRPEGVAADRDMPRDVPVTAEEIGGGGGCQTPDIPGNRSGALGDDAARIGARSKVESGGGITHGDYSATIVPRMWAWSYNLSQAG